MFSTKQQSGIILESIQVGSGLEVPKSDVLLALDTFGIGTTADFFQIEGDLPCCRVAKEFSN